MFDRLSNILQNNELHVTKCEPWNSVKVTFNLPKDAAEKLSGLAEAGEDVLRELGILSLQVEGGQIVSMTLAEAEEGEAEEGGRASPPAVSCKPKISPKEESRLVKQEPDSWQSSQSSQSSHSGRPPGLSLPLLQAAQQSSASRESIASAAALQLLKNHSSSSSEQQSVLQSYNEGLLASLIQSNSKAGGVSSLFSKDNGEPVNKKPRKSETESPTSPPTSTSLSLSPKSKLEAGGVGASGASSVGGANNFPYSGPAGQGFSLLPVVSPGSQSNSSDSPTRTSPSALRIASLPGVSLTAVGSSAGLSRNTQPTSHSQKLCKASLMPPPHSGVTLSPVPRTAAAVTSPAELRCIETGDISSSSSSSPSPKSLVNSDNISSSSSSSSSSTQSLEPRQPLLINPVTGQFEAGASSEAEQENNKNPDPDSDDAGEEEQQLLLLRNKHKSGSQSPGISTSEPSSSSSLKVKLKMSSIVPPSNNSSKNSIAPKNDTVTLKTSSNNTVTSKSVDEPKVPKIKIRLGKDKNSVKFNSNDLVENHDGNDLDDTFSSASQSQSQSPTTPTTSPKIKIKPVGGSPVEESGDSVVNNITSPHFPNLANSIVNHNNMDDRKKKKVKDRLAVWTESLAKHGQREESKEKDEKVKDTKKSWPEVLEARLGLNNSSSSNSSGGGGSGGMSFSKSEPVLENQTEPGDPDVSVVEGGEEELTELTEEDSTTAHLNYRGPGQELPGPGLTPPASLQPQCSADRADQHDDGPPQASSLNAVLDILEGRPSLGEPLSPDCPQQGGQDQAGQQGEDSGIESMDSRSEKSPNQGESPFHASSECGVELGRTPTYSSSMGHSESSGKLSPPVSDPGLGCSDSASPPDKSQPVQSVDSVQLSNTESSVLTHSSPQSVNGKNNFLEESHKVTTVIPASQSVDPQFSEETVGENHVTPINSKIEIINSNGAPSDPANTSPASSEKNSLPFVNHHESSEQAKTENGGPSLENNKNDLESKSVDLLRSCDGADDLKILPTPKETAEITNCMHDYIFKDSNNSEDVRVATSDSVSPPPADPVKALLPRRLPEPVSVSVPEPVSAPAVPISAAVSIGGLGGLSVRPALHVPPGARMVPVKLVTVPGAGNVRMLRVSPVKSGIITAVDGKMPGGSLALPPRTVVIKSSVLRTVSSQEAGPASLAATPSLVSFPGQTVLNCDIAPARETKTSQSQPAVSQSSIVTFSQLKKSHQVSLTPVENTGATPPSFSSDSSKAAPVTFQKRVSLDEVSGGQSSVSSETPLSVDVSNRLTDAEQMPSPAQKAAQKFQHQKFNGEEAVESNPPASPKPERTKGKKSNSGDLSLLKNDSCGGGESLLRPLLAREEAELPQPASLPPAEPLPSLDSASALSLPLINPRKRTRRDTGSSVGSSVASDRSDQSLGEASGKRSKGNSPARRKSEAGDSSDSEEKQKCSAETNGISEEASSSSKASVKSGERTKGRPTSTLKNSTNINNKVELNKTNPKKVGIVKKVGRPRLDDQLVANTEKGPAKTDNSGRRVSTRSKKPDELGAANNKRR